MLLTIGNNKENCAPQLECIARGRTRKDWVEGRGPVGGYVLVVGCGVGLCWNMGEACRRLSHICGSWYLPKFLFRGVPVHI